MTSMMNAVSILTALWCWTVTNADAFEEIGDGQYMMSTDTMTWDEGKALCESQFGTTLATITGDSDAEIFLALAIEREKIWIGLREDADGQWGWESGHSCDGDCEDLKYWATNNPNGSGKCGWVGWKKNSILSLLDDTPCRGRKKIACDTVQSPRRVLAASGACMHGKKFTKGYTFPAPYAGKVIGIELSNPVGGFTTNKNRWKPSTFPYWGQAQTNYWLHFSLIQEKEEGNEVMYPTATTEGMKALRTWDCPLGGCSVKVWRMDHSTHAYVTDSEFMRLMDADNPYDVSVDDVFSLQVNEGCCEDPTINNLGTNNLGTTCADVHFVYESIEGPYEGDSDLVLSIPLTEDTECSGDGCLEECEGGCDTDDQCEGDLVCWQRSSKRQNYPPGCSGHHPHRKGDSTGYCYDPDRRIEAIQGEDPANLRECEGDCDSDKHCLGNLKCYTRVVDDPLPPGCKGSSDQGYDYCYDNQNLVDNARQISESENAAASYSVHAQDAGESVDDFAAMTLGAAMGVAMVAVVVAVIVVMRRRKRMDHGKGQEVAMSEVVTAPKVEAAQSMDGVDTI